MKDLIDRQAAIDAVKKNTFRLTFAEEQNCEGYLAWSANAVYSDVIEGALLELPSAQPETTERTAETAQNVSDRDLISRQAAIDALHMHLMYRMGTDSNKKRLDDWINGVPSAQETHEERTETHACDLIERQDAIDALHRYFDGMLETDTWSPCDVYGLIEILPSAQQDSKETSPTHKALDTISRKAAIEIASGFCHPANIAKELAKLPSAQPEIIRCKDCKHFAGEGMYCSCDIIVQFDHFYCYHAERRQDV